MNVIRNAAALNSLLVFGLIGLVVGLSGTAGCGGGGGDPGTGATPTPTPSASASPSPSPSPSPTQTPTPVPTATPTATIASIFPSTGRGGDTVTVTGTGFDAANPPAVYFHFQPAFSTVVVNSTTLTVVVPAKRSFDPAVQDINSCTPGGCSYALGSGPVSFTYVP